MKNSNPDPGPPKKYPKPTPRGSKGGWHIHIDTDLLYPKEIGITKEEAKIILKYIDWCDPTHFKTQEECDEAGHLIKKLEKFVEE